MKIGIFGGTFNPLHTGHLVVIESVRDQLHFDKIVFIPSANPPNKRDAILAPASKRLEMAQLAVAGNEHFEISDIEIRREGLSYTVDTVRELTALYPRDTLSLIMGSDNLLEFQTWKSPEEIISMVDITVMSRPGTAHQTPMIGKGLKQDYARLATFVSVPQIGISGTDIRRRVKLRRSIRYLVPVQVEEYIYHSNLYRE